MYHGTVVLCEARAQHSRARSIEKGVRPRFALRSPGCDWGEKMNEEVMYSGPPGRLESSGGSYTHGVQKTREGVPISCGEVRGVCRGMLEI